MTKFGFIGTGHLGSMLVRKFVQTGTIKAEDILASNRSVEKLERLAGAMGISAASNLKVAETCDVIFICVWPRLLGDVLAENREILTAEKLLISVAADVSLEALGSLCNARISRAFPSMASENLEGVTLLAHGSNTTLADRKLIEDIFGALGEVAVVCEKDFGVLGDLTSSAPGYIAALMQEFARAAQRRSIPLHMAEQLLRQTLLGSALLLREDSFMKLLDSVATKGGITEAGVGVIQSKAPELFDQLFRVTQAKHELIKKCVDEIIRG
jgi:competence protein ComER